MRWTNDSNAPQIQYPVRFGEEAGFIGDFFAAILYGIIIVLFFQCVGALLSPPSHTGGGIRWILVAHTVAMFLFVTVETAMGLNLQSTAYINNRDFPEINNSTSPGPPGYKLHTCTLARSVIPNSIFQLNQWLADGLLLYRCCVLYAMDYRVIAFPCLVYLASFVLGLIDWVWNIAPGNRYVPFNVDVPYLSISLSLNVLLTLMIIVRLVLHTRRIQIAMGVTAGVGRLYTAIVTILVESCALYAATFLPFLALSVAKNQGAHVFWPILNEIQVIAPFLIIQRVANQDTTRDAVPHENVGSIQFQSQGESTSSGRTFLEGSIIGSMGRSGDITSEHDAGAETPSEKSRCGSAQNVIGNPPQNFPVFLVPFRDSLPRYR